MSDVRVVKMCCGQKAAYSEAWDAYYCGKCNKWLEPVCGTHNKGEVCPFNCEKRPPTPTWTP